MGRYRLQASFASIAIAALTTTALRYLTGHPSWCFYSVILSQSLASYIFLAATPTYGSRYGLLAFILTRIEAIYWNISVFMTSPYVIGVFLGLESIQLIMAGYCSIEEHWTFKRALFRTRNDVQDAIQHHLTLLTFLVLDLTVTLRVLLLVLGVGRSLTFLLLLITSEVFWRLVLYLAGVMEATLWLVVSVVLLLMNIVPSLYIGYDVLKSEGSMLTLGGPVVCLSLLVRLVVALIASRSPLYFNMGLAAQTYPSGLSERIASLIRRDHDYTSAPLLGASEESISGVSDWGAMRSTTILPGMDEFRLERSQH